MFLGVMDLESSIAMKEKHCMYIINTLLIAQKNNPNNAIAAIITQILHILKRRRRDAKQ